MTNQLDIENVARQYSEAFKQHGDTPAAVFMPKGRQSLRFASLTNHIPTGRCSILDFGCGLAHLKSHLDDQSIDCEYTGTDIVPEFILHASQKYPKSRFFLLQDASDIPEKYDHVIACGVFNMLYCQDKTVHDHYVFDTIGKLFDKCTSSLAINFMTDIVDFEQDGAYHQNISSLLGLVRKALSTRLTLDHSYMPYEYSVVLYKENRIERPANVYLS